MNRPKRVASVALWILPSLLPFGALACGGGTPDPAVAKPAAKPAEAPPDLSPVPAPSTLLVFGRVA